MANSSERAYDRDVFMLEFAGGCAGVNVLSLEEYDENIAEIEAMISYFIHKGNEEEIRFWRAMLQRTKVEKRRAKMKFLHRRVATA